MGMTAAKFQGEINGLSSIARKVYDAVPILEEWGAARVLVELKRQGVSSELAKIEGCLSSLVRSGLVREPKRGQYIRQYVKDDGVKPVLVSVTTQVAKATEKRPAPAIAIQSKTEEMREKAVADEEAPINDFSLLSQKLRGMARAIEDVANEIDNAAVKVSDRIAATSAETSKFKQLHKLLKELS